MVKGKEQWRVPTQYLHAEMNTPTDSSVRVELPRDLFDFVLSSLLAVCRVAEVFVIFVMY